MSSRGSSFELLGTYAWTTGRPGTFQDAPALSVERYVLGEDDQGRFVQEDQFPKLLRATATFDRLPGGATGTLKGKFDCVFVDQEVLWGDFEASLTKP